MSKQKNNISPSPLEWDALYKAALEFKAIAPWEWMSDTDMFGVVNPLDGEIGYCCVLGEIKEVFGLAVYLGTEGLDGYLKVQEGVITVKDDDILHTKKCLLTTFDDKKYLEKPDFEIIKGLGFNFKGANAWPLFRSYEPGLYPWYLTKEQVCFLTLCLQQAKETALRFKENKNLFDTSDRNIYFMRTCDDSTGSGKWIDSWIEPASFRKTVVTRKSFDEQRLEAMIKKFPRQEQTLEMDYFYAPMCVTEEGKRPYFPLAFLFVDSHSYFIFHAHVTTKDKYLLEVHDQFLKAIENAGVIPQEMRVKKQELLVSLEPLAKRLGIEINIAPSLRAVDDARKSMFEHFDKRKSEENTE